MVRSLLTLFALYASVLFVADVFVTDIGILGDVLAGVAAHASLTCARKVREAAQLARERRLRATKMLPTAASTAAEAAQDAVAPGATAAQIPLESF